jgi:hypothetical protein
MDSVPLFQSRGSFYRLVDSSVGIYAGYFCLHPMCVPLILTGHPIFNALSGFPSRINHVELSKPLIAGHRLLPPRSCLEDTVGCIKAPLSVRHYCRCGLWSGAVIVELRQNTCHAMTRLDVITVDYGGPSVSSLPIMAWCDPVCA